MPNPTPNTVSPPPIASQTWYAINRVAATPAEAEISIYDEIGGWGVSASKFVNDLKAINASTLNLRLHTPGGEVFDATAIYNALREHPARVIVHVDGLAASAGSVIAMAGDEVRMADNAYLMIHKARGGMLGGADELRTYADMMDKINANIAATYAKKAGSNSAYWLNLMDAETWFTAEEAKAAGLVDTVYAAAPKAAPKSTKAAFDLRVYNKVPDAVMRAWGTPTARAEFPDSPPSIVPLPVDPQQINTPAPEASLDSVVPPLAASLEHPMPEPTSAPATTPALPPAAPVTPVIQQGDTPYSTVQEAIANFKAVQGPRFFEDGRKKGAEDAAIAMGDRVRAIVAACPGKPEMAVGAILSGQSPDAIKLAFDSTMAAETRAREEAARKDVEIARLHALLALGGYPGGVPVGQDDTNPAEQEAITDPKAHAEREWDFKPSVRKGFDAKASYVAWRVRDLNGTVSQAVGRTTED